VRWGLGLNALVSAPSVEPSSILFKAFLLLRAFSPNKRIMSLTEISRASGLSKSTVHRLLERLQDLDAIEHNSNGYSVSLAFSQLGALTPAASGRDIALPYLAWLHKGTGHVVNYGVRRDLDVVFLEKLKTRGSLSSPSSVGRRLPANCTAIGKALLSWEDPANLGVLIDRAPLSQLTAHSIADPDQLIRQLRAARADGLAREQDEAQLGLSCVGAPIVVCGFAVGALSLSYPTSVPLDVKVEDAVRVAATRISRDFRHSLQNGGERCFPYPLG
jgi:DNA-binding IclR family transcriptional regulator